jgi:glycosyltransferase involved in cell wall biosynthesis
LFTAESVERAYGRDAWVCHPGVDESRFTPPDPSATAPRGAPYVLAVGALHWLKGHELTIEGVARLAQPRPDVVIVHDRSVDAYADRLRDHARRLGVTLHLRRDVPDDELVELYRFAVATICASRLEPFGLTALESASCGTPVVALAEGGFRETVVDAANGFLVEPCASGIAAAVESIRHGALGRDREAIRSTVIPRFSWDATVARLHELFARAAAGTGSR